jgi:hypothetical protein
MSSDTEDTSAQSPGLEYVLVLALHDLVALARTESSEDRQVAIQKNASLLRLSGAGESLIQAYVMLGETLSFLLLSRQASKVEVAFYKTSAVQKKKREEALSRPTRPVQGRGGGWKMTIQEFRKQWNSAEKELGADAPLEAKAKKVGLHVTTIREYRKRDEAYEQFKKEYKREPTEAEINQTRRDMRQKRRM